MHCPTTVFFHPPIHDRRQVHALPNYGVLSSLSLRWEAGLCNAQIRCPFIPLFTIAVRSMHCQATVFFRPSIHDRRQVHALPNYGVLSSPYSR